MNFLIPLKKQGFANADEARDAYAAQNGAAPTDEELAAFAERNPSLSYADIIKQIVRAPTQAGFDEDTMRKAVAVLNAVDDATAKKADVISISEDTYRWLRGKVIGFRYAMAHQSLLDFIEDVRNAEREGKPQ